VVAALTDRSASQAHTNRPEELRDPRPESSGAPPGPEYAAAPGLATEGERETDQQETNASVAADAAHDAVIQPMPPLSAEQESSLRDAIGRNGVAVPITVDQHGRILDGHNRFRIAAELGIDCPRVVQFVADDDDALDRAVELNCARRHLTQEQVREVVAAEIDRRPDQSDRQIARRVGCSPTTVGTVRRLSNLDTTDDDTARRGGEPPDQTPSDVDLDLRDRVLVAYDHLNLRADLPHTDADARRARAVMIQDADQTLGLTLAVANGADQLELATAVISRMALWKSLGMDRQLIRRLFVPWLDVVLSESARALVTDDPALAYLKVDDPEEFVGPVLDLIASIPAADALGGAQ